MKKFSLKWLLLVSLPVAAVSPVSAAVFGSSNRRVISFSAKKAHKHRLKKHRKNRKHHVRAARRTHHRRKHG